MYHILYLNFELLENILEHKCLRFVVYHWLYFRNYTNKVYKNEINTNSSYNSKAYLLDSFLKIEKETVQKLEIEYQKNSIIIVNYLEELKQVQQIVGSDCTVTTLFVNESEKESYIFYTDFFIKYTFKTFQECTIPELQDDSINKFIKFVKNNSY